MTSIRAFFECHDASALWLSDSFRLSDNLLCDRVRVVRFYSVIGQSALRACPGCPILLGYRTICFASVSRLSDSSWLSDNLSQEPTWSLPEPLSFFLLVIILILSGFYCQQGENVAVYKHLPPWKKAGNEKSEDN